MSFSSKLARNASHAGSWYTESKDKLSQELNNWLDSAGSPGEPAQVIIGPHAGYFYSGSTAAYAYKQLRTEGVKRVFILGPSHRLRLSSCGLSKCSIFKTPLMDLHVDESITNELLSTKAFTEVSLEDDENEHSLELHLPYVAKVFEGRSEESLRIVPIIVGSLSKEKELMYGRLLSKYFKDPSNVFIISSDFCHWGSRFEYTYLDESHESIWKSIEALDKMGMDLIESFDHDGFSSYLKKYGNTICGRHPIGVFLGAVKVLQEEDSRIQFTGKFIKYAQSSKCKVMSDSSVSYASGVFYMK